MIRSLGFMVGAGMLREGAVLQNTHSSYTVREKEEGIFLRHDKSNREYPVCIKNLHWKFKLIYEGEEDGLWE